MFDSEGCVYVAIAAAFVGLLVFAGVMDSCKQMHEREMELKYGHPQKEAAPVQEAGKQEESNPICECTHRLYGHLHVINIASGKLETKVGSCVTKECACEDFKPKKELIQTPIEGGSDE